MYYLEQGVGKNINMQKKLSGIPTSYYVFKDALCGLIFKHKGKCKEVGIDFKF